MISFGTDGWRAIIGDEFTLENVRKVAQGIADYLKTSAGTSRKVYVGHDRRFRSRDFALEIAQILAANSYTVSLADQYSPTPCISWMVKADETAAAGVVVTASHNPFQWNGIKLKESNGGAATPRTTRAVEEIIARNEREGHLPTISPSQKVTLFNPHGSYIAQLKKMVDMKAIRKAGLKILYDPMFGAGSSYLKKILGSGVTETHSESNPGFGGINPEPIEANLSTLKKEVVKGRFHLGIANDGDADRIGAVDEKGRFVDAHHLFALILKHLVEVKRLRGDVVKTVTATHMIDRLTQLYGLPLHETPVGFKHIGEKFMELKTPMIGGEESGGIGICHHLPERDGLLSALILLEIMATHRKPLSKIISDLRHQIGTLVYRRVDLHVPREKIDGLIHRLRGNGLDRIGNDPILKTDTRDGFKFYLKGDAWLLIRPSGTEPLLRTYAEAPTLAQTRDLLNKAQELAGRI